MEAVGIAASILQVAAVGVQVGSALGICSSKLYHANRDLGSLAKQVGATSYALNSVANLLSTLGPNAPPFTTFCDDIDSVSQGSPHESVDSFERKCGKGKHRLHALAKVEWLLKDGELTGLRNALKHYMDVLQLMLSVLKIAQTEQAPTKDDLNDLSTKFDRLSASHEVLVKTNKELSTAKSLTEIVGIIARSPRDLAGPSSSTLNFCLPVQTALVTPSPSNQLLSLASFPTFPQTHAATTLALDSAEPALSPDTQLPSLTSFPTYLQANLAVPQASNPPDQTHDHLQRCLDSVQEPARAISSAISAWQGHGRTGSSDIHGSHARLALELAKLPRELECKMCSGRVPWSDFDLVEAASGSLGTCVCSGQSSSRCNWRPLGAVATDAPITNAAIKTPYSSAETLEKMARLRCKRNPVKDR